MDEGNKGNFIAIDDNDIVDKAEEQEVLLNRLKGKYGEDIHDTYIYHIHQ